MLTISLMRGTVSGGARLLIGLRGLARQSSVLKVSRRVPMMCTVDAQQSQLPWPSPSLAFRLNPPDAGSVSIGRCPSAFDRTSRILL